MLVTILLQFMFACIGVQLFKVNERFQPLYPALLLHARRASSHTPHLLASPDAVRWRHSDLKPTSNMDNAAQDFLNWRFFAVFICLIPTLINTAIPRVWSLIQWKLARMILCSNSICRYTDVNNNCIGGWLWRHTQGTFYECTDRAKMTQAECKGEYVEYQDGQIDKPVLHERSWSKYDFNFDNVAQGMLTLFTVSTFEGWPA